MSNNFFPECCQITINGNISHIENLKGELSPGFLKPAFNKNKKRLEKVFLQSTSIGG